MRDVSIRAKQTREETDRSTDSDFSADYNGTWNVVRLLINHLHYTISDPCRLALSLTISRVRTDGCWWLHVLGRTVGDNRQKKKGTMHPRILKCV